MKNISPERLLPGDVKEKEKTESVDSVDKKINIDDVKVNISLSMDVPKLSPEGIKQLRKAIEWIVEIDGNKEKIEKLKEKARRDLGYSCPCRRDYNRL